MDRLQNMQALMRVVETGSYVAASRTMGVSTAQVSRLVADLEEHLNTRLLNRTTRRVSPTAAGERYLERVRHILASVDEAESEAREAHVKASGVLRVHCLASFALHHLIPLLAKYRKECPDVSVELTLAQRIPKLAEEGYDVAIVLSPAVNDSALVVRRIASSFSVLCATPEYLRVNGVPKIPADLANHTCLDLVLPGISGEGWTFHGPAGVEAVALRHPFRVNVAEAMLKAIETGMGVGLLPGYSAARALREGRLVRVLPDYRMNEIHVFALYPSRRFLDAKIRTWIDFLNENLPAALAADKAILESPVRAAGAKKKP